MAGQESKIDTKLFVAAADAIEPEIRKLEELAREWQQTLSSIRGDWQGDSSDDIRNTAAQVQKSSEALLKSLSNYPGTLREMAGIYDKTEKNVQESGKSLKFGNTFK